MSTYRSGGNPLSRSKPHSDRVPAHRQLLPLRSRARTEDLSISLISNTRLSAKPRAGNPSFSLYCRCPHFTESVYRGRTFALAASPGIISTQIENAWTGKDAYDLPLVYTPRKLAGRRFTRQVTAYSPRTARGCARDASEPSSTLPTSVSWQRVACRRHGHQFRDHQPRQRRRDPDQRRRERPGQRAYSH